MEAGMVPPEPPVAPQWAGRVPRWKIARLYEGDASGLVDEALVDDVAYAFYARCESMVVTAEAHRGRATCPVCSGVVEHNWNKDAVLVCGACGWKGQWGRYWRTYKGKRLKAGGLEPFCREYISRFPSAKSTREKMLLIDWLIHRFHWEGREGLPGRPGAVGLIGGSAHEVDAFLQNLNLAGGISPVSEMEHASWTSIRSRQEAAWKVKREERGLHRERKRRRKEAVRRLKAEAAKLQKGEPDAPSEG